MARAWSKGGKTGSGGFIVEVVALPGSVVDAPAGRVVVETPAGRTVVEVAAEGSVVDAPAGRVVETA